MRVLWQNQNNDRRVTPLTLDSEFSILYSHVHLQKERERESNGGNKKEESKSVQEGENLFKKEYLQSCSPKLEPHRRNG